MDNGWFATMTRDDVTLITEPIDTVSAEGPVTADGILHGADILVLATGFDTVNYSGRSEFVGVDGAELGSEWGPDDAQAYLGIAVPQFPNLFFLYGPNTNPHAGSILFYSQCQARYIAGLVTQMIDRGISAVDCDKAIFEDYIRRVDDAHSRMVWTHPRVSTYYRNERGRVVNNSPWRQVDYFRRTSTPDLSDYATRVRAVPD